MIAVLLPFADASVDIAIVQGGLHHFAGVAFGSGSHLREGASCA